MRNERSARVARGSAIALFATFTASLAHTLGGGLPPGLLSIALALAFSMPFAIGVVGRRATGPAGRARTAVAAVGAQLALHALYSLGTAGAAGVPALTDVSGRTNSSHAHGHHAGAVDLPADGVAGVLAMSDGGTAPAFAHDAHPGTWMLVTHAVAAALTIVFIASTDRVLAAVAASARGIRVALVLADAPPATPASPARSAPIVVRAIGAAHDLHLLTSPRRGPPSAVAAA